MADAPKEILDIADADDTAVSDPPKRPRAYRRSLGAREVPLVKAADGSLVAPSARPQNLSAIVLGKKNAMMRAGVADRRVPPNLIEFGEYKPKKRRKKLNDVLMGKLCKAIRKGAWDYVAAGSLGISPVTFSNWLRDDQEFASAVWVAKCQARQDAEWFVARTDPKMFLKQMHRHAEATPGYVSGVTTNSNTAILINDQRSSVSEPDLSALSLEELQTLKMLHAKAVAKPALPPAKKQTEAIDASFVDVSSHKPTDK